VFPIEWNVPENVPPGWQAPLNWVAAFVKYWPPLVTSKQIP
jgi:hypothetical protein